MVIAKTCSQHRNPSLCSWVRELDLTCFSEDQRSQSLPVHPAAKKTREEKSEPSTHKAFEDKALHDTHLASAMMIASRCPKFSCTVSIPPA